MRLHLAHGTPVIAGEVEARAAGSLRLSEPRERTVLGHVRGAYTPAGALDPETIRWWGPGQGSPIESVPEALPPADVVQTREDEVLWGGCIVGHFGHFLIETASRLWPLLPGGPCEGMPVVFTTRSGPRFTEEWLEGFGVDVIDLPADGAVRFNRLVIPEPAWRIDAYVTPEMREIHLKAREGLSIQSSPHRNLLWLSRSEIEFERRVRDEVLLEWILDGRMGVVHPESMTLAEQVAAIESADVVSGAIGSAFHSALMARKVPKHIYFTPARVASTFVAQDWLLDAQSSFVQTLAVEQMEPRRAPRRESHRLLVPETLRTLDVDALPGLLGEERPARFAAPELPAARVGQEPSDPDLDSRARRMLLNPHSIDARMELGAAFEAAGKTRNALEQYHLVSDWTSEYAYGPLRAARLLAAIGRAEEAAEMAERVLAVDPDSEEAARYAAAGTDAGD